MAMYAIRDVRVAAPLKLRRWSFWAVPLMDYPRRTRRGPVEACDWRIPSGRATSIRDVRVAAPLKRVRAASADPRGDPIRDVRVAAPLKRLASAANGGSGVPIRDVRVAAPLKHRLAIERHDDERLSATYASRPR